MLMSSEPPKIADGVMRDNSGSANQQARTSLRAKPTPWKTGSAVAAALPTLTGAVLETAGAAKPPGFRIPLPPPSLSRYFIRDLVGGVGLGVGGPGGLIWGVTAVFDSSFAPPVRPATLGKGDR